MKIIMFFLFFFFFMVLWLALIHYTGLRQLSSLSGSGFFILTMPLADLPITKNQEQTECPKLTMNSKHHSPKTSCYCWYIAVNACCHPSGAVIGWGAEWLWRHTAPRSWLGWAPHSAGETWASFASKSWGYLTISCLSFRATLDLHMGG